MPTHPLHLAIGGILEDVHQALPDDRRAGCALIKDPACVGGPSPHYVRVPQNIPLFCSTVRSNPTEYCSVDALVMLGGTIKVIVEIEESALGPTQVFGKFLTSAARCYVHDADGAAPVLKDDRVLFVKVMRHVGPEAAIHQAATVGEHRVVRPLPPTSRVDQSVPPHLRRRGRLLARPTRRRSAGGVRDRRRGGWE